MTANEYKFCYPDLTEKGLFNKEQEYTITDDTVYNKTTSHALFNSNHVSDNGHQTVSYDHACDNHSLNSSRISSATTAQKSSADILHMFARLSPKDDDNGTDSAYKNQSPSNVKHNLTLLEKNQLESYNIKSSSRNKTLKRQISDQTNYESWFIKELDPFELYKTSTPAKLLKLKETPVEEQVENVYISKHGKPLCSSLCVNERRDRGCGLLLDRYSEDKENLNLQANSELSKDSNFHSSSVKKKEYVETESGNRLVEPRKSPYEGITCQVKMSKTVSRAVPSKSVGTVKEGDSVLILNSSFQQADKTDQDAIQSQENQEKKPRIFNESVVTPVSRTVNCIFEEVLKQKISLDDLPNPNKLRKSRRKQKQQNITEVDAHQRQLHKKINEFFGGTSNPVNSNEASVHRGVPQRAQHDMIMPLPESKSLFDIQEELMSVRSLKSASQQYTNEEPAEADIVPEHYTRSPLSPFERGQTSIHDTSLVLSSADYIENQASFWGSGTDHVRSSPFLHRPSPKMPINQHELDSSFKADIDSDYSYPGFSHSSFDSRMWGGSLFKPDLSPIPELGPSYKAFYEEE